MLKDLVTECTHKEEVALTVEDIKNGHMLPEIHAIICCVCNKVLVNDSLVDALIEIHGEQYQTDVFRTAYCGGDTGHMVCMQRETETGGIKASMSSLAKHEAILSYCKASSTFSEMTGGVEQSSRRVPKAIKKLVGKEVGESDSVIRRYLRVLSKLLAVDCVGICSFYADVCRLESQLKIGSLGLELGEFCRETGNVFPLQNYKKFIFYFCLLGSIPSARKIRCKPFMELNLSPATLFGLMDAVPPEDVGVWRSKFAKAIAGASEEVSEVGESAHRREVDEVSAAGVFEAEQESEEDGGSVPDWTRKTQEEVLAYFNEHPNEDGNVTVSRAQLRSWTQE